MRPFFSVLASAVLVAAWGGGPARALSEEGRAALASLRAATSAEAAAPLAPPRVRFVRREAGLAVWVVDGTHVRQHLDEEFTNFGQHYAFPFIPEAELWLDEEAQPDEQEFFIAHLVVERRLMARGVPYDEALGEADEVERRARRAAGDLARFTDGGRRLPDPKAVHRRLWKKLEGSVSVWIVDGRAVRSVFYIDFTAGGHDYVYEFVPQGEVWIDDDLQERERGYVLLHELHERNRMAEGMTYGEAHELSSALELRCRKNPDELHDALAEQGW